MLASPIRGSAEDANAERLFREGRELLAAGKHDEACAKFAESLSRDDQLGPRLNLALCNEKRGRVHSALVGFEEALRRATAAREEQLAAVAQQHIVALKARIPHVRVNIDGATPPPRVVLRRTGSEDVVVEAGKEFATDPTIAVGEVIWVEVTAPGFETFRSETRPLREATRELFTVPPLVPVSAPSPPVAARAGGDSRSTARFLGWALLGSGVALTGGSVFYSWRERSKALVDDCRQDDACRDDHNQNIKVWGTSLFVAGLATAAAGTYLVFFRASGDAERSDGTGWMPVGSPTYAGVSWGSRF